MSRNSLLNLNGVSVKFIIFLKPSPRFIRIVCFHIVDSGPVCVIVAICHRFGLVGTSPFIGYRRGNASQEIVGQFVLNVLVKVHGIGRIDRVYQTVAVYREVEQECGIVAHTAIIEVCQLLYRLHTVIFFRMIDTEDFSVFPIPATRIGYLSYEYFFGQRA